MLGGSHDLSPCVGMFSGFLSTGTFFIILFQLWMLETGFHAQFDASSLAGRSLDILYIANVAMALCEDRLTFVTDDEPPRPLVPDGASKVVDASNVHEYICRLSEHMLCGPVRAELHATLRGLWSEDVLLRVCGTEIDLHLFHPLRSNARRLALIHLPARVGDLVRQSQVQFREW